MKSGKCLNCNDLTHYKLFIFFVMYMKVLQKKCKENQPYKMEISGFIGYYKSLLRILVLKINYLYMFLQSYRKNHIF